VMTLVLITIRRVMVTAHAAAFSISA